MVRKLWRFISGKPMNVPVKIDFSKSQLQVIRTMCAKDCDNNEFDLFLEMCRARGLNPLLKQIYAMVLHKDSKDPKKPRQLVIIVSIEGSTSSCASSSINFCTVGFITSIGGLLAIGNGVAAATVSRGREGGSGLSCGGGRGSLF